MVFIRTICVLIFSVGAFTSQSQTVYKTPSGKKYHLASCRMVENVSKQLVGKEDIESYGLEPCKICSPPHKHQLQLSFGTSNKAVGEGRKVRCKGYTQNGGRCKHITRLANGYCFQHTDQDNKANSIYRQNNTNQTTGVCGAKTKSGSYCKRKVKGGGKCYQHD